MRMAEDSAALSRALYDVLPAESSSQVAHYIEYGVWDEAILEALAILARRRLELPEKLRRELADRAALPGLHRKVARSIQEGLADLAVTAPI